MEKQDKSYKAYYLKETIKWLAILNELKADNTRFKNRLSEAISGNVTPSTLEEAELLQQRFVEKDIVIELLRHEISILQRTLLSQETVVNKDKSYCLLLAKDMKRLAGEFYDMNQSFSLFLSSARPN